MPGTLTLIERSRRLHLQVRDFVERALHSGASVTTLDNEFVTLACEIATYQTGRAMRSLEEIVRGGVVSDCFRFGPVFAFDPSAAQLRFQTSGTTSANAGVHYMRESATYERISLAWGKASLGFSEQGAAPIVVALAPWGGTSTASSLGYMMQRFMEHFDGCSLTSSRDRHGFVLEAPERWLLGPSGIDIAGLRRVRELAWTAGCRVAVLATSFALVELLDAAGGETLELPPGSVIMPTGGFKGRTRTIEPATMHAEIYRLFGDVDIVGEYGMTELTSQLYEATSRFAAHRVVAGTYLAPPWLRVIALDPTTLDPVGHDGQGLACFIDLGNVDSAVCVLTQDVVRVEARTGSGVRGSIGGNRVQLLGRQPKAPLRGCSLAIEALLGKRLEGPAVAEHRDLTRCASQPNPDSARGIEPDATEIARVMALINAAGALETRLLGGHGGASLASLAVSSGLSVEGVCLALQHSLETNATFGDARVLVQTARRSYGASQGEVWVLLSSNVFTAPLRAIALAAALSARVKVRPSRREPQFSQLLRDASAGAFEIVSELAPETGDVVLAYGSDQTLEAVRASLPPGVRFFGHGHGMGAVVVAADADVAAAASALALDIVLFDQQGCLSPRLVLVDGASDAGSFATTLARELETWEQRVPLGHAEASQLHDRAWSERLAGNLGRVISAGSGFVACYDSVSAHKHDVPIPSAPRCLSVVSTTDVLADLGALGHLLTSVGVAAGAALTERVKQRLPNARVVQLGTMQRPPFDGPVDRRFL